MAIRVTLHACSREHAEQFCKRSTSAYHHRLKTEGIPSESKKFQTMIFAVRKVGFYRPSIDKSGKWMIFPSPSYVDAIWNRIHKAVEEGQLGNYVKVMGPNHKGLYVICVYTYDYEDIDDVMRIREVLRVLGIRQLLSYKSDQDTEELHYGRDFTPKYRT